MLPAEHRMRNSAEFRQTIQNGRRAGRRTVVVHVQPATSAADGPCKVGLVVSKQVGNSVTRNRVKRRLRHLMRPVVVSADAPAAVVVRALPACVEEPDRLASDLERALLRAVSGA